MKKKKGENDEGKFVYHVKISIIWFYAMGWYRGGMFKMSRCCCYILMAAALAAILLAEIIAAIILFGMYWINKNQFVFKVLGRNFC